MPHQCTNCGHVFEDGSKEMLSGCPDCGGNKFQYHPGDVPKDPTAGDDADEEPPEPEGGSVSSAVGRAANRVRDAVSSGSPSTSDGADASSDGSATDPVGGETTASTADAQTEQSADAQTEQSAEAAGEATVDDTVESATAPETEDSGGSEAAADATPDVAAETEPGVQASTADSEDGAQAEARSEVVDMTDLPERAEDGRVVKEPDDSDDRPDIEDLRQELNDQFESIRIVAPGQYELNLMELYDRQEYIIALQEDGQYVIEVPDAWEAPDPADVE
jgi:predicted  nucleic acid-binding Zn-ribbon protein